MLTSFSDYTLYVNTCKSEGTPNLVARVLAQAAILVSIIMVVTYETDGLMVEAKSGKLKSEGEC